MGFLRVAGVLAALVGVFYQLFLKDFLFTTVGVGRVIQPLADFPYTCRRVQSGEQLEGCEDLWLDEEARVLYAACSGTTSRQKWNPAMGSLDFSGRRPQGAELIALDVDSTASDLNLRVIKPTGGYKGATGDNTLDYVGFDVEVVDSSTLRFYLVNQRPPVDASLKLVDATKTGSNATIEIFELKRGASKMKHIRTVYSPAIFSPNRVAVIGDGAFVVSNDHSARVGLMKELETFTGGGDVAYCAPSGECHSASVGIKFTFPNGLTKGKDGLIYVPSAADGTIKVFELQPDKTLKHKETVKGPMPLDNLSVDSKGDIYAAGFPSFAQVMGALADPFNSASAATVLRLRKGEKGYELEKVLEDGEREALNMVTTATHDAKTGKIYLGSAMAPYIMICDPK